jgi:hypothetical protein
VTEETLPLRNKFSALLAWEKIKRRETILLAALAYAFLVSLALLPFRGALPSSLSPFYAPLVLFVVFAAAGFFRRPWRETDAARALAALDRELGLEERALTAADILMRDEADSAERYVLSEAGEKLKEVDVRALFRRRWSWQALAAPPLLLLWSAAVWFGAGADFAAKKSGPASVAENVKEFAQELKQKAEAERLAESLQVARALQALAEERLGGKSSEEKLGENLAAIEKRLGEKIAAAGGGDLDFAGRARDELAALRAELEALRGQLRPGGAALEKDLLQRLESMPRLGAALAQGGRVGENMAAGELRSLLDKLEREIAAELDRRALADAENFLSLLLRGGQAGGAESQAQIPAGRAGQKRADEKAGGQGEFAGDQSSARDRASAPPLRGGAATRVEGMLGEGASSGFSWRGEAKAGASKISEEEIAADYRRQVEEDLAAEKIPPALKETVKKYFLSLGMAEKK